MRLIDLARAKQRGVRTAGTPLCEVKTVMLVTPAVGKKEANLAAHNNLSASGPWQLV